MLIAPLLAASVLSQKTVTPEQAGDDYTITTRLRVAQPYDVHAMNDEFQSARLISEAGGVGTFEIVYRPFHVQRVTADPNWRSNDAKMTEYLRPRPAANWTPELRKQILADLKDAGIDPNSLDDKTLVERVSAWALGRSTFNSQFGLWMVEFVGGKPQVAKKLRDGFESEEPHDLTDSQIFDREVLGDGMYRNKTHGSCTSTSTYMTTILRAIGIPTRIILTVPACDPNDPMQVKILTDAVRHFRTRRTVKGGLSSHGFVNHVFNEVWVGGKWVRLNYSRLGQPILDQSYLGLMTHVYTANDVSDVPFPATWGARYSLHEGPLLSSENPYQLLSAKDHLKAGLVLDNPPVKTLTSVTVIAVLKPDDPNLGHSNVPEGNDAFFQIKEWIQGDNYVQLGEFLRGAGRDFLLQADGQPDVHAQITGFDTDDERGTFQAFGVHFEGSLVKGVKYRLVPQNEGHPHTWQVQDGVVWQG